MDNYLANLEFQILIYQSILEGVDPNDHQRRADYLTKIGDLERRREQRLVQERTMPPLPSSPSSSLVGGRLPNRNHVPSPNPRVSSAPQLGSSIMSPPQPRPFQPGTGHSNLPSGTRRKRQSEDAGLLDVPGPSSKRPASRGSPLSTGSSQSATSRRQSDATNASDEELFKALGIDDRDSFREFQQEQKKAEEFLEQRKEDERRNAEFARSLQESLLPPPRPNSAQSVSTNYSGSNIFNGFSPEPASPFIGPGSGASRVPPFPRLNSQLSPSRGRPEPSFAPHFNPGNFRPQRPSDSVISLLDSDLDGDESDIAEITAADYGSRIQHSPFSLLARHGDPYSVLDRSDPHAIRPLHAPYSLGSQLSPSGLGPGTLYGPNVLESTVARLNATNQRLGAANDSLDPLTGVPAEVALRAMQGDPILYDSYLREATVRDSARNNEEIKQLLETIRPDTEISKENREGTPDALKYPLLEHQKLGVSWMKAMEESEKKGGILADDMGLGKTIQALALMVSRPSTDPQRKPTLIVAPVSLMQQWKREIHTMVKPACRLSVYILHGERRRLNFTDLMSHDVVLTTFGTLAAEYKRKVAYEEDDANARLAHDVVFLQNELPVLGPNSGWHRVIIDEAQCIKNRNSKAAQACCLVKATYRWCMSGTPMMNSVQELHSLIKFLRIRPYCELERFTSDFTRPLKNSGTHEHGKAMRQLQALLKAILLRRTKTSTIDGNPILRLPERVTERVHAVFDDDERQFYNALETRTQIQFNRYLNANSVGRNYSNILTLLLRLRQACCHPHLIKDFSVEVNASTKDLDLIVNAKAFSEQVVVRVRDNENLECPICMDAVDNPLIFFPCGHSTCAECFSRISDPALSVRQGVEGTLTVKCPNCRGQVDPKKITDHTSFRKVHFPGPSDTEPEPRAQEVEVEEEDASDDESEDDVSSFVVGDKGKGKGPQKQRKTLADLKKEGSRNLAAKRKYLRRLDKTWISSAKIDKTMEILQGIQGHGNGEKTIIFSQFTSLLDLLEVPIYRKNWGYRRYDGAMRPVERNKAVMDFTDDPECKIMLVSLKAGNSGLNLVAASQVIIFDPFWNPYVEEQAIDRAHRIGQMREVHVHRILVPETVEDRIIELQEKKRSLIEGALDENAGKSIARLGTRELAYLFGVRN